MLHYVHQLELVCLWYGAVQVWILGFFTFSVGDSRGRRHYVFGLSVWPFHAVDTISQECLEGNSPYFNYVSTSTQG